MDDPYDVIICGTGMVECVLAGILGVEGKRVLVMDRNRYYGGDCASLQLEQLYKEFNKGEPPAKFGKGHLYNVDLCPKLLLGGGNLVKILSKSVAERYSMSFTVIQGSYILHKGKIQKVPITPSQALGSSLMGIFEKRRCGMFLKYIAEYDVSDPKTHEKRDLKTMTFHALAKDFGLDGNTEAFIGTAVALELDQGFLSRPALPTVMKLQLYLESQMLYKDSPYVYPVYGLGDIPQAFARLCAVFQGVFMLNKPDMEVVLDASGNFAGVKSEDKVATAPIVIGDPTYFPSKVRKTGDVVRAICILDHPIPGIVSGSVSCQIILPAQETKRRTDTYVLQVSSAHKVCPDGLYLAIVSATMEDGTPEENIRHGMSLIGPVMDTFIKVYPQYAPDSSKNVKGDGCFIGSSLDATTHFENEAEQVLALYKGITGHALDIDSFVVPSEEDLMRMHVEAADKRAAAGAAAGAAAAPDAAASAVAASAAAAAAAADAEAEAEAARALAELDAAAAAEEATGGAAE